MILSVIIVSWNTKDLAIDSVNSVLNEAKSLLDHKPSLDLEIIIVDNASVDGSPQALEENFSGNSKVRMIKSGINLGFAKACNQAYRESHGEYILLLNPDTAVLPGALGEMLDYFQAHPDVGIVGPRLLNPDGSIQPSVRRFPDIWSSLAVFLGLHRLFRPRKYYMDGFDYHTSTEVEQVMGAALMTRKQIIEKLGLFDEKFWLWYEEVDFCKRVKSAGFKIIYLATASVMHKCGSSFVQLSVLQRKKILAKSLIYYFQKNGTASEAAALQAVRPLVLLGAAIITLIQRLIGKKHV